MPKMAFFFYTVCKVDFFLNIFKADSSKETSHKPSDN